MDAQFLQRVGSLVIAARCSSSSCCSRAVDRDPAVAIVVIGAACSGSCTTARPSITATDGCACSSSGRPCRATTAPSASVRRMVPVPRVPRAVAWSSMFIDGSIHQLPDIDQAETAEWLDSLDAVVDSRGKARAHYLLARLMERARDKGVGVPLMVQTDYINTIPPEQEPWFPGDEYVERRIRAFIRWNAVLMVDRANHRFDGLGGHLSTYASAAVALRGRLQPLLPRQGRRRLRRPGVLPGSRRARASTPARSSKAGSPRTSSTTSAARSAGSGLPSYPHPRRLPDVLGVPDGVDGARPDQRGVPGALQPLPLQPPARRHVEGAGVVLRRRRRDGRARGDRRAATSRRASGSTT